MYVDNEGPDKSTRTDLGLRFPLTESLNTTDCMNEEKMPGWYFAHAQDDLNLPFCACPKLFFALRKHAYSNILKILQTKQENCEIKILVFFIFLLNT